MAKMDWPKHNCQPVLRVLFACLSVILASVLLAGTAHAQDSALTLSQLQIDLWPEYDRQSVLVIYRMSLSPDTPLPAEVSLRIPREVGKPHKVAQQSIDGLLYDLEYTLVTSDEWLTVKFTALSQQVRVEYYDPRLERVNTLRTFRFAWPSDFEVEELVLSVQQPRDATRFELQPDQGVGREGLDGMVYYTLNMENVSPDTQLSLDLTYESPNNQLSNVLQPVQPVEPLQEGRIGWTTFLELLPLAVLVFGAIILAGSALWYWQSSDRPKLTLRGFGLEDNKEAPDQRNPLTGIYCRECGKRALAGDLYCRACGARLPNASQ